MSELACNGGPKAVIRNHPHYTWPPKAELSELREIAKQRNTDIVIKGNAGPIGELEKSFLSFLQNRAQYAIAFNSGTSGLLAAYVGVGIEAGDEVLVPAITYHAAVSPLMILQARPILIDVDPDTWCINPALLEQAITKKTKAITVVHQWGHPADMDTLLKIAKKHNLKVIEDCSHAHGSMYKDKPVGTLGDVGVFSLQANKLVFAGEGGMLVTSNQEIHDRAVLLGHYRDRAKESITDSFYQQFWVSGYGMKLRMSPFNAIVALHALRAAPQRIKHRKKCLDYFRDELVQFPELSLKKPAEHIDLGAWYGFKPLYDSQKLGGVSRKKYITALQAEGVEVKAPSSPPFSKLALFQVKDDGLFSINNKAIYKPGDFPVAEMLSERALSLPTFTTWPHDKVTINQYLAAFRKVHEHASQIK